MRVFRPKNPSKAVYHNGDHGPHFSQALAVGGTMNHWGKGLSVTEGSEYDDAQYCVPVTPRGNSVLTGDNAIMFGFGGTGRFTCRSLEVFLIE